MKTIKLLFLIGILVGCGRLSGQMIRFLDCDAVSETRYNGIPFYAIRNTDGASLPFGSIRFMPDGESGWVFAWTYEGNAQPVVYEGDSTYLTAGLAGNGVYAFEARKGDDVIRSGEFTVFYVYMPFTLRIEDEMDCHYITLRIDGLQSPPVYAGVYPGAENPLYTVVWGGKERVLTESASYYTQISQLVEGEYRDVECRIKIKDRYGLEWESNTETFHSYIPSAEFSADPMQGEAPLEVIFTDESENAQQYEWYLYKDTVEVQPRAMSVEDSLLEGRIFTEQHLPPYVYEHPGSYNVKLVVVNTRGENHCSDTFFIPKYIVVDTSLVDVPNVFTPNGDGVNDIFRAKTQSLEYFHGVILNRWGRKVYEWDDPQEGWNGKIHGKYASPGTYYYIITARGREIRTKKYVKKGPLLLVR